MQVIERTIASRSSHQNDAGSWPFLGGEEDAKQEAGDAPEVLLPGTEGEVEGEPNAAAEASESEGEPLEKRGGDDDVITAELRTHMNKTLASFSIPIEMKDEEVLSEILAGADVSHPAARGHVPDPLPGHVQDPLLGIPPHCV